MIIKKYPLQILFIESLICLLTFVIITQVTSKFSVISTPCYLLIALFYSIVTKKPIEYCKLQKDNNKTLYLGSYTIVLSLSAILMWYLWYVGELNLQKYVNGIK